MSFLLSRTPGTGAPSAYRGRSPRRSSSTDRSPELFSLQKHTSASHRVPSGQSGLASSNTCRRARRSPNRPGSATQSPAFVRRGAGSASAVVHLELLRESDTLLAKDRIGADQDLGVEPDQMAKRPGIGTRCRRRSSVGRSLFHPRLVLVGRQRQSESPSRRL
jgi:hypothetical protein